MKPYQYVNNNLIMFTDPTGMNAEGGGDGWLSRTWNNVKTEVKSWFTSDKKRAQIEFGELTGVILPDYEPNKQTTLSGSAIGAAGVIKGVARSGSADSIVNGIGSYLSAVALKLLY